MDIEDFVKDVLAQITNAVNMNNSGGDIKYTVDYGKGVDFDLAVTTELAQIEEKGLAGGIKVRIVSAEASKGKTTNSSLAQTSRVSFNVNLRKQTDNKSSSRQSLNFM